MKRLVFSPSWHRVAQLQPRLRGHAQIHRHFYREELWYVLQDHASGRAYRFTPVAYQFIGMMDGRATVQELWEKTVESRSDDAPTQGEIIHLLSQLHAADSLICNVTPNVNELFQRRQKINALQWKQRLFSPLFLRFPLWDPDRFLTRTEFVMRPIFSRFGAFVWIALAGSAMLLVVQHWPDLTRNAVDRILSMQNLLLLSLLFPFVKAFHELGHAYAVKRWGGEVHEIGIMLLVFMPLPYVDASSASAFRDKRRRMLVSAAGILVELFIASLALHLWLSLEEGYARSVCYNIIVIASISTLLFNGNPLLRYDGYYILSDYLEIQNLAQRGLQYLGYLFKRYLFGMKDANAPYTGPGERFWLIGYSIASFCYRILVYAGIILFVAGKFFVIGVILAAWGVITMLILPVYRRLYFVMFSPALRQKRVRAVSASVLMILLAAVLLFVVPFPLRNRVEGVIWAPQESLVRAGTSGFVHEIKAPSNAWVEEGDLLIECQDPMLNAQVKVMNAEIRRLEAQYDAEILEDRVKAEITREQIQQTRADLARAQERACDLLIRSPNTGVFILPGAKDLPGLFVNQGDLLAYVLNIQMLIVRTVVPQSEVDLVRHRTDKVDVRLVDCLERNISARLKREVPGAIEQLPSTILGSAGGGEIAIDPWDQEGLRTFERLFQFDIELTQRVSNVKIGGRAYVLFDHGSLPLGRQWIRSLRLLFLRRFNI